MTTLLDIISRRPPEPWRDGDNIPWHEPGFSARMLQEHLAQYHNMASRRTAIIDAQVAWIAETLLGRPGRVLDLACGPGLYTERLARHGYACTGIDYSPASIEYATSVANEGGLRCAYVCDDLRRAEYGKGYDLAMLISGELNSFRGTDAEIILRKARAVLAPGGTLLLETHTHEAVVAIGSRRASWYAAERGLFSEQPHICLQEHAWDEAARVATVRYFIIDAANGDFATYATSKQAYSHDDYLSLLRNCGFSSVESVPSLIGAIDETQREFTVLIARKE